MRGSEGGSSAPTHGEAPQTWPPQCGKTLPVPDSICRRFVRTSGAFLSLERTAGCGSAPAPLSSDSTSRARGVRGCAAQVTSTALSVRCSHALTSQDAREEAERQVQQEMIRVRFGAERGPPGGWACMELAVPWWPQRGRAVA